VKTEEVGGDRRGRERQQRKEETDEEGGERRGRERQNRGRGRQWRKRRQQTGRDSRQGETAEEVG
jgi:hypothetical protein